MFTLFLGLFLGVKHAFDADHLVAVSTLVSSHKNPLKAAFIGTFWGIGHTVSLFITGLFVLLLRITIPEKVSLSFELLVGALLVILGLRAVFIKDQIHAHLHKHDKQPHVHFHLDTDSAHRHQHKKSFLIGMMHGLAGSAALTLLVLSTISSATIGMLYILIFGLGSIIGMSLMSLIFGLPFIFTSKNYPGIEKYLRIVVGSLSVLFGSLLIYETGKSLQLF